MFEPMLEGVQAGHNFNSFLIPGSRAQRAGGASAYSSADEWW